MNEVKRVCKECNSLMRKVGPFASVVKPGQPYEVHDGSQDYNCVNSNCKACGDSVNFSADEETDWLEKMNALCGCGHTRSLHDHSFGLVSEGQPIPTNVEKDIYCSANDCECEQFIKQETT